MIHKKKIFVRKSLAIVVIIALFLGGLNPIGIFIGGIPTATAAGPVAVTVVNSGFETVTAAAYGYGTNNYYWKDTEAKPWSIWAATGIPEYSVVSDVKHSGEHALRISHTSDARSSISQDVMGVAAGETYRIGMWIKTEDVVEKVLPRIQYIT